MNKKILIVGREDSVLIEQVVENISKFAFDLFLFDVINHQLINYRYEKKIRVFEKVIIPTRLNKSIVFLKRIISGFKLIRIIKKMNVSFDILQIHYNKYEYLVLYPWLRKLAPKRITSIWGSDFWRNPLRRLFKYIYNDVEKITMTSPGLQEEFLKYYNIDKRKTIICPFGLKIFDEIDNIKKEKSIQEIKEEIGISKNKIIVTIGYCADSGENQLEIIKRINRYLLDKNKIAFIFPLTYGDDNYKKEVITFANKYLNGFEKHYFTEFLCYNRISKLRMISDIFFNIQNHDQLSAGMLEYMYSGTVVITGEWLPYKILKDNSVYYKEIKNIDEVGKLLIKILDNLEEENKKCNKNHDILEKMYKWEYTIKKWKELFD